MKSREVSVQAIFDESGEIKKFLWQNGGQKFSLYDCAPSKAESVQEFLQEALNPREKLPVIEA